MNFSKRVVESADRMKIMLRPVRAVQSTILDGLAQVFWRDVVAGLKIRDGARNFQDSVMRTS